MKKLLIALFVAATFSLLWACQKDSFLPNNNDAADTELMTEIANTSQKTEIDVTTMPNELKQFVAIYYNPIQAANAYIAPQLGYELILEDATTVYFDLNSNFLGNDTNYKGGKPDLLKNGKGCHCLKGDSVALETLPAAITDYITANYPGQTAVSAATKPNGSFAVLISGGQVLIFKSDGSFAFECTAMKPK